MKTKLILVLLITSALISCEKLGSHNYTLTGKVQKGPFIAGSELTLYQLDGELNQTGNTFHTTISADDGGFEFTDIDLSSDIVEISANGFYFSEIYGTVSPAQIYLHALADVSKGQSVNINVLTHIIKKRIENLTSEGVSYQDAKLQAESELLTFLGVSEVIDVEFENFDISQSDEQNAVLLAFSVMIQRFVHETSAKLLMPAELTALLSTISSDFGDDGKINPTTIDTLLYNISNLNLLDIRDNIETRYSELGSTEPIPTFEKYIAEFQKKYSNNIYTSFVYPEMASPDPISSPDAMIQNILVPQTTEFAPNPYCVAAITPINSSLTIKLTLQPGSSEYAFGIGMLNAGWKVDGNINGGITFISQRQNEIMALLIDLMDWGTAIIEYYEEGPDTPTFTKTISWGVVED